MILGIYTVFDRKAGAHLQPFYARSDAEAMRMIKETLLSGKSKLCAFPEDFHLYSLGDFDDQTGEIQPGDKVSPVASVSEILDDARRDHPSRLAEVQRSFLNEQNEYDF